MYCKNCGKQIPENAKFCNYCGAAQGGGSAQNTQQSNQQPNRVGGEKEFKKYISPYVCRNIFLVMCALTIGCLLAFPPAAVIYAGVTACFGIPWVIGVNRVNKNISEMRSTGAYEKMLREFSAAKSTLNDRVRYSENYIFGKGKGYFFDYKDIYWVYRHNVRYVIIPVSSEAMIGNQKGKIVPFCGIKLNTEEGNKEIKALATLIYNKNPRVLLGFDAERQNEYKRRTR